MRVFFHKAQSILEYSVLLCLILSSLLIMQVYIKRGYQGRLKQEADQIGPQYSPGHTTSLMTVDTTSETKTYTGGKTEDDIEVPDGVTVTKSTVTSDYEKKEAVDSFATEGTDEGV